MSLISPAELAARPDAVICDVRFYLTDHEQGRREYEAAHLPGARFVDLHHDLADTSVEGAGRHPLPSPQRFADLLASLGIRPDSFVVAYDSAGGAIASRMWWMLRSIGHADVAVLDGGIQAWEAEGLALTDEVPEPPSAPAPYPVGAGWTGTVTADQVADGVRHGLSLVDARAPERYRGENEPIDPKAGHIPGAINVFHGDTVGPDGRHLSRGELAELFSEVGERPVVYCGSGVTACHNLLALSLAGTTEARLYPGSWSEWSTSDRPVG